MIALTQEGNQSVIALDDRFDFSYGREFTATLTKAIESAPAVVCIDMLRVQYIDSSALGYLLVARETATAARKEIILANLQANVKAITEIAKFSKLFKFA